MNMRIAHLVNIFTIEERHKASYLHVAMPVTLSAMYNAAEHAHLNDVDVQLFAVKYKEDDVLCPNGFKLTSPLESLYDGKLPYIAEIFSKFNEIDADYYIYSNIDITPEREFYIRLQYFLGKYHNFDSFTILRNDVSHNYWINKESTKTEHPGHDCFAFKQSILKKLYLPEKVFLGFPPVGTVVYNNLQKVSKRRRTFPIQPKHNLTYHLGSDKSWMEHPNIIINTKNSLR